MELQGEDMADMDYMLRAIELAKNGLGRVNPNPLVGAVIVKDGEIIGEGFHARYGDLHAERNAIKNLKRDAEGATMYVTLEPCCHYGKQPPCTEAIIENKIARVVVGSRDPNPLVAGKGVEILRKAGIEVETDFMKEECDALNPVFFHYITTKRPYVAMKYAMTADGKIATRTGESKWISGEEARRHVHYMRGIYTGIMTGIGTVLADDPMLNARAEGARNPVRIICDSALRIPTDCKIVQTAGEYKTYVACALPENRIERGGEISKKAAELKAAGVELIFVPGEDGKVDLCRLADILGEKGIDSILLEGGGILNDSALRCGIVKEVHAFIAPKLFGGRDAPTPVSGEGAGPIGEAVGLELYDIKHFGADLMLSYKVKET